MKLKYSLIALVVLAVLVVAALIVFREPPTEQMKASFPEITKDSVTKIWIRNPVKDDGEDSETVFEEVTLVRQGEGEDATWKMTEPVDYPAYTSYVDTLTTRLSEMELADVAVEKKQNWSTLDVDDEKAVHVKVWSGENLLAEFWVGAYKTGHTMLRLPDDERVFKVQGSIRYVFAKRVRDWREKTVLDQDPKNVTRIAYQSDDSPLVFEKTGEEWAQVLAEGEEPIEHFDPKKVQSFVSTPAKLRTADFADGVEPADVGLDSPRAVVEFTVTEKGEPEVKDAEDVKAEQAEGEDPMDAPETTTETFRVLVGDETDDGDQTHIMVEGNPQIFLVTQHVVDRLMPEPLKFATPPRPEGETPAPMGAGPGMGAGPPMAMQPPAGGPGGGGSIPPEVMKQVQAEIKKQKMMKKLQEKMAKQK